MVPEQPAAVVGAQDVRTVAISLVAVGAIIMVVQRPAVAPWLVWNTSPSVPLGLYVSDGSAPDRGDVVLARLPRSFAMLAHRRGYLPKDTYLLKPVVAIEGDRVCRLGRRVIVRGASAAIAALYDTAGRRLPVWHGCRALASGEVFVLARASHSLDSRYFGPLGAPDILGRAIRLGAFTRPDR